MERWIMRNPKADLRKMSASLGISSLLCKILVNRELVDIENATNFIKPDIDKLHNPRLMKDLEKGVDIIKGKIAEGKKIRIVGDYDVDGIISTYLLYMSLTKCGAKVDYDIPHRILDGYGINISILDNAKNDGVDTVITCDNGISAIEQIEYAKKIGLTVIITDHHEVPFIEAVDGDRRYTTPIADAIIDIKQIDCKYPFKLLCGAGVAFKFVQVLFEEMNIPVEEAEGYLEFVAIATVCDVVDLIDENRVFVKRGLELINNTQNFGLKALMQQTGSEDKNITVYYLGFILGPCINASGRLDCARKGLELLLSETFEEAEKLALELHKLNTERKEMTVKGVDDIIQAIENSSIKNDKVFVVYKSDIHESIAGIIAGRVRECYNVPTIVLTDGEDEVKGSGRSIEEYNMFEELLKCKDLLTKFGGHPMAAGLSLKADNVDILRKQLNSLTTLRDEDLIPKVYIDAQLYLDSINFKLANELKLLEPYGKGNSRPLFAEKNISIYKGAIFGANKNVLKLRLFTKTRKCIDCIYFGDIQGFQEYISCKFGDSELDKMYKGQKNNIKLDIIYNVDINEYNGRKSVQLVMQHYR